MRRRIPTQTRRAATPAEWLPVSAAIAADANRRIGEGRRPAAEAAAEAELRAKLRAASRPDRATTEVRDYAEMVALREAARKEYAAAVEAAGQLRSASLSDLSLRVAPEATGEVPAPAYYREDRREIVVDAAVALPGVDPASVRWSDRRWRLEHLRAVGLVEHELGHAAHTPPSLPRTWAEVGGEAAELGRMLEEGRMEASHLRGGGDREALAGVASELILRDFPGLTGDTFTDAMNGALILGRDERHGGCLSAETVRPLREAFESVHGAEWLAALDELLAESNAVEDTDVDGPDELRERFRRWRERLGAAADPDPASGEGEGGASGEGEGGASGESEASEGASGGSGAPAEGERSGLSGEGAEGRTDGGAESESGETGGEGEGAGGESESESGEGGGQGGGGLGELPDLRSMLGESGEGAQAAARDLAEELKEEERRAAAEQVEKVSHGAGRGHAEHHGTQTVMVDADTARLRSRLTRELRRLALPEVARSHVASELPPGRLRGRGAVLREAQASVGLVPTARPFRQTRKAVTKAPPPVVGIMLDVSGSMGAAAGPVARLGWALTEAGAAIQARTALATFGDRGRLVEHRPRSVTLTDCGGSFENWREGFEVLDGRLHLTSPARGARLLVIVTDGYLVNGPDAMAAQMVTRWLEQHGVGVVWVALGVAWHGAKAGIDSGSVVVIPEGAADPVGPIIAAVEAAVLRARIEVGR